MKCYGSASEVVRNALRGMEERDAMQVECFEALRQDINKGLDSLEHDGSKPLYMEAIKAKGRAKLTENGD